MSEPAATTPARRRRRPGPLPVLASGLAAFLAVFTLLAAQLRAGVDPGLRTGGSEAVASASSHGSSVVTRTSGGAAAPAAGQGQAPSHHPVVTRASAGGGAHDD